MKLPSTAALLRLACLLALAGVARAQPLPPAEPPGAGFDAARLDDFMRAATGAHGYLGGVVLVARRGRLLAWQAWGARDTARSEPMTRDAIFRLYSMTKPIASVAALMLVEAGRLGLDDPVARHLPAFADLRVFAGGSAAAPRLRAPARVLTIRHLMTHTAGFATGGAGLEEPTRLMTAAELPRSADLADFATRVAAVPLGADPGTRFGYDGVNTEVLARIVEVASGERFEAFLQRRIFAPLRMTDTGFAVPPSDRARIAAITTIDSAGALAPLPGRQSTNPGEALNAYASGAGGLYATGTDYLRFCQMLLDGGTLDGVRLLQPATVALLMRDQLAALAPPLALPTSLNPGEGFGLGGSVVTDAAQRGRPGALGAFGWSGAASTYFTIDPARDMIAILLLQHLPGDDAGRGLPKLGDRFFNLVHQAIAP